MQQQEHDAAVIARALDKLIKEGSDGSYLIVAIDEVYLQFLSVGDRDEPWIYCEAVSNQFLPEDQKLEPEQITALTLLGFEETIESPNYSCDFIVSDTAILTDIGRMTLQMFATIYLCPSDSEVDIDLHIEEPSPELGLDTS
ncbi:MAG: hypothetical protein QF898_01915 [SAR202 cluster bacterium]|nr:hypothetical protein [SAR202 cluster bacterium]MDP6715361.1 hypothetical protein [SAR202 cluster bacterium]